MGKIDTYVSNFFTLKYLGGIIFILVCYYWLKFALRRRKYSKDIPHLKTGFFNVFGNISLVSFNEKSYNGYPMTAFIQQLMWALSTLFGNEDLFVVWLGFIPLFILRSPEAIEEVYKGTKMIEKAWPYEWMHCWLGSGLLTSKAQKWKSRRKLLTPAFHMDILKNFLPIINEKSKKFVEILEKESSKDFTNIFPLTSKCSLDVICETTLGINVNAQENDELGYIKAVERLTSGLISRLTKFWNWLDVTFFLMDGRTFVKDIKLIHDFIHSVIQTNKEKLKTEENENNNDKNKRKPLMRILLEHQMNNTDITDEDIREEVDVFTFGGHDTTAAGMAWALYLIGLHHDVQRKIQEELRFIFGNDTDRPIVTDDLRDMKYLECVIKETFRLYPPICAYGRTAVDNVTICGHSIPSGAAVFVVPSMIHMDEKIFPNPDVFDPERFKSENLTSRHPYAYLPFSLGPRDCIGKNLGMMEVKTVLANVLRNFNLVSLDPRDKILSCAEVVTRPSHPIRIRIIPRNRHGSF